MFNLWCEITRYHWKVVHRWGDSQDPGCWNVNMSFSQMVGWHKGCVSPFPNGAGTQRSMPFFYIIFVESMTYPYVYIYTYKCIHICLYMYICIYLYFYIHTYIYIHLSTTCASSPICKYIFIYTYTYSVQPFFSTRFTPHSHQSPEVMAVVFGRQLLELGSDLDTEKGGKNHEWFWNPVYSAVEVGSLPHYLRWILYVPGGCLAFLNHQQ